jgi:hypothetical protein
MSTLSSSRRRRDGHYDDTHIRWYALHRDKNYEYAHHQRRRNASLTQAATAVVSMLTSTMSSPIHNPSIKIMGGVPPRYRGLIQWNVQYLQSPIGTLGPSTISSSAFIWSTKGERTLSRFRLEICPAAASELAAGCKPMRSSLAFAREPTPLVPHDAVNQMRIYFISPSASNLYKFRS